MRLSETSIRSMNEGLAELDLPEDCRRIAVAVSGGGDSMALLAMLSERFPDRETELFAVSVDHGLRPESEAECGLACDLAHSLGHEHKTLVWKRGSESTGNVQSDARDARYRLIANWAKFNRVGVVALAHTLDDQAETLLLNLARGSGVDGLAAMPQQLRRNDVLWIRPLLSTSRAELRQYLSERGIRWAEDPSNEDNAYDRVKARRILDLIAPLGASTERLAATAERMGMARRALESAAYDAACRIAKVGMAGDVEFEPEFWDLPEELKNRLAAQALRFRSGAIYKPRFTTLRRCLNAVSGGGSATLSGCAMARTSGGGLLVARELAACPPPVEFGDEWDGRWMIEGYRNPYDAAVVGALGERGIRQCADWKSFGLPRISMLCSPALWSGEGELLSAPLAGEGRGWTARLSADAAAFLKSVLPD